MGEIHNCDLRSFFKALNTDHLESLTITNCNLLTEGMIMNWNIQDWNTYEFGFPNLEILKLENCANLKLHDKRFKHLIEKCPKLRKITLHWKVANSLSDKLLTYLNKSYILEINISMGTTVMPVADFVKSRSN